MEKLNPTQLNEALKDVRNAYRLLALYQQRILDVIKYIANGYGVHFNSGWSKFSNTASKGNRANISKSSWEWLALYMYEFNLGTRTIGENHFHFKVVHQADTGFYDVNADKKIAKQNVDQFEDASASTTRLIFVLSKNVNGCPIKHHLKGNLSSQNNHSLFNDSWLSVPYNLERFSNQASADIVLKEFNQVCVETFGVKIMDNGGL